MNASNVLRGEGEGEMRVSLIVGFQRRDIKYHPLAYPRQYASQESEGISTLICLRMYEKQVKKDH
jgi:hypothetical protein